MNVTFRLDCPNALAKFKSLTNYHMLGKLLARFCVKSGVIIFLFIVTVFGVIFEIHQTNRKSPHVLCLFMVNN